MKGFARVVLVVWFIFLAVAFCYSFGRKPDQPEPTSGQVIESAELRRSGFVEGWNRSQEKERRDIESLITQYREQCSTPGSYPADQFDADTCKCVLDFALKNLRDRQMAPPVIPDGY